MSLYKYFKKTTGDEAFLPDPSGPLSTKVPSSTIAMANKEVVKVLGSTNEESNPAWASRGQYKSFTPVEKATIAKYAIEVGVTKAISKLQHQYPGRKLKEPTVRLWVTKYKQELHFSRLRAGKSASPPPITKLENKKRGRPLLIGMELDNQVQSYVSKLREKGGVVNSSIVQSAPIGIVMSHDANLLKCNGGHIEITKFWALSLLQRMGFVKRRSTTKCKISVADVEEKKAQFLYDIQVITTIDDIPPELVINWDNTGINYVPISNWTMAAVGSKRVEICGVDDKRQITPVFAGTLNGHFLPPQLIYQGKTTKCLLTVSFPQTWHVTHTSNHWANEVTTEAYINEILLPYITSIRECKGVTSSALVIFDRFKGQCTPLILSLLSSNNSYSSGPRQLHRSFTTPRCQCK